MEKEYNALWNSVLMEVVNLDQNMIHPQYSVPESKKLLDFLSCWSSLPDGVQPDKNGFHPEYCYATMFVKNKPGRAIKNISTREDTDDQMRKCFNLLRPWQTRPILYGIATIGTKFVVYHMDESGTVHPPITPRSILVTNTAPAWWWAYNIMTAEGQDKMEQVCQHINAMCCGKRWSDAAVV